MFIYKRFERFRGDLPSFLLDKERLNSYKIRRGKAIDSIRTKSVDTARSISANKKSRTTTTRNKKLRPLNKENVKFLTELGYKVLKKN